MRAAQLKDLGIFDEVRAISVRKDEGCEELFEVLARYAAEGPHYFPDDAYTYMP